MGVWMRAMSRENQPGYIISKQLDIRGKVCPLTFVYTKLTLEELEEGTYLEVILDFPAAIKNIPQSCKRQSLAELVEVKEGNSEKAEWIMILKKL